MDLQALRDDTPGLSDRIHLDNCGSSLMPRAVIDAVKQHFELEIEVGGYVAQERAANKIEAYYSNLAKLLGGSSADFAFTASAVEAWVRAFYSVPMQEGDILITAYNEYCANFIAYMQQAERRGIEIKVVGPDANGALDMSALAQAVSHPRAKLVSLSHISASSGQVHDVASVGALCKQHGVPFLLDACQSVGQTPVSVDDIGCDMLTGTGRKFLRGPRGTGFLYVGPNMRARLDPVFLTNASATWIEKDRYELRTDTRLFEGWERSIAGLLGLSAGIEYFLGLGIKDATDRTKFLAGRVRSGLADIPGVTMTCPPGSTAAIITFNLNGWEAPDLKVALEKDGIAVQVARTEHTRLDLEARELDTIVRVSPNYYNSEAEIDRFLDRIESFAR